MTPGGNGAERVLSAAQRRTQDTWADTAPVAVRPSAGLTAPTRPEQGMALLVMFVLMFSVPSYWFLPPYVDTANDASRSQIAALCVLTLVFALLSSNLNVTPFLRVMRQEALLPLFIGLVLSSIMWTTQPYEATRDGFLLVLICFVGYWIGTRFPLSSVLGLASIAVALGAVLQVAIIKFFPEYGASGEAWIGVFKDKNVFGRHISLALLILMLASRIHRRYRFVLYGVMLVELLFLVKSDSKTSVVAAVATPLMAGIFVAFRARRTLYGSVAIAIVASTVGAIVLTVGNLDIVTRELGRSATFSGRTDIWKAVFAEVKHRPLLGYGWDGFFTDVNGPARMVYLKVGLVPHSHNALLDYAAALGYVGAGLALLLFMRLLVRGARVIRYYRGAAGLFPIVYGAYAIVTSVTEFGVIRTDAHFLFLVIAIVGAVPGRRDQLDAFGLRDAERTPPPSPRAVAPATSF